MLLVALLLASVLALGGAAPAGAVEATLEAATTQPQVDAGLAVTLHEGGAAAIAGLSAPVLSLSGETVQWHPIGLENAYLIAVSNAPRGAAGRVTHYQWIARAAGEAQSFTPTLAPGETVYVGVFAEGGTNWSEQEAAVTAPPPTPVLSVSGGTVQWTPIGAEQSYLIAVSNAPRGAAGRVTHYQWIARAAGEAQSFTPTLAPGETVYVGVLAEGGAEWSEQEATVTAPKPPPPPPPPAPEPEPPVINPTSPVLQVKGDTLSWQPLPGISSYELATVINPTGARETTYTTVTGTSFTPPTMPGDTVTYGLAAHGPLEGPWGNQVTIAYPPASTEAPATEPSSPPTESTTPTPPRVIIGANDAAGWGSEFAHVLLAGHITWNRVEIGSPDNPIGASEGYGFHDLAIVGNVPDETLLSGVSPSQWAETVVSQIRSNPGIAIAEAGNEMYLKGGVANPVQYGRMYLAAVNALKAAGIKTRLLFNMFGDYAVGSWAHATGWSQDANNGGWLRDAVNGVPGLAAAIAANGLSSHPYGALGENNADYGGVDAIAAQEGVAHTVLGSTPPIYITEFGFNLANCGASSGACSQEEQASKTKAAYKVFLGDPHVAGIWWYQAHDDGTGQFGILNANNTTRPAYNVLAAIAAELGQ